MQKLLSIPFFACFFYREQIPRKGLFCLKKIEYIESVHNLLNKNKKNKQEFDPGSE